MKTVTVIVTVDLLVLANSDAEATGIVKEKKAIVPLSPTATVKTSASSLRCSGRSTSPPAKLVWCASNYRVRKELPRNEDWGSCICAVLPVGTRWFVQPCNYERDGI
jgi:hypothetical protein